MDMYNALQMHYIAGWFASLRSQLKCQLLERAFSGFGLPWCLSGKESIYQCRRFRRPGFNPWVRKIPWRRKWQPILVFLSGKSHGWRSLAGYGPWGHKESDMTERLTHTEEEEFSWIWKLNDKNRLTGKKIQIYILYTLCDMGALIRK